MNQIKYDSTICNFVVKNMANSKSIVFLNDRVIEKGEIIQDVCYGRRSEVFKITELT